MHEFLSGADWRGHEDDNDGLSAAVQFVARSVSNNLEMEVAKHVAKNAAALPVLCVVIHLWQWKGEQEPPSCLQVGTAHRLAPPLQTAENLTL